MDNSYLNLSIIIVNYISYEDTIKYVNMLLDQKQIVLDIIIVDNKSPNNSFHNLKNKFANDRNVHVIESGNNGGYSFGNNVGLKYIEEKGLSELIIISNNDIEFGNDLLLYNFVKRYSSLPSDKAFASPLMVIENRISSVAAKKLPSFKEEILEASMIFSKIFGLKTGYFINKNSKILSVDCLPGSFFLGTSSLFREINYFDENLFLFGEEKIIAKKVKNIGRKNYLICDIEFMHTHSKTISSEVNISKIIKLRNYGKIYFWKNYSNVNKASLLFLKIFLKLCELEYKLIRIIYHSKLFP